MSQKEKFLDGEGDAYWGRNTEGLSESVLENDKILAVMKELQPSRVLEVGCADGARLNAIHAAYGAECYGLEPSKSAVERAGKVYPDINVQIGTAESLPYGDGSFDAVVFGFCLYVCDRKDLFRIASEADRVVKDGGYIVIFDFFPPFAYRNAYRDVAGMYSYKMDYATMFTWNPAYHLNRSIVFEDGGERTQLPSDERISVSILCKRTFDAYPLNPFSRT